MKSNKQSVKDRENPVSDPLAQPGTANETATTAEVQAHRTNMTIIHFLFTLPKWSIGLFLFLASHTSPVRTMKLAIQTPIQELQALVQLESQSYRNCVRNSSPRLQRLLDTVAADDRNELAKVHDANKKQLQAAQDVTDTCLSNTQTARRVLLQWQDDGMALPWWLESDDTIANASSTFQRCTAQERNQTERLLGNDFAALEDQVAFELDLYVEDSESSLERVQSYAVARVDYDYRYFIQDRIQPALDYLAKHSAEIQAIAVTFEVDLSQLQARFRETLHKLETALEHAKGHIDVLQRKLEEFVGSIHQFHAAYTELYRRLELSVEFTAKLLPTGVNLPNFLDMSKLNVPEFYLPDTPLSWPELEIDYQSINDLLEEMAEQCTLIMMEILDNVQAQAADQLRAFVQELAEGLNQLLELRDYDPPQFEGSQKGIVTMADQFHFQTERGEEIRQWTGEAFSNLRRQAADVDFNASTIRQPNISAADYSYVENTTKFEYLSLLLPSFSLPEVFTETIDWLMANTWAVDIFLQVFRLWKLESTYSKGAIPDMPELDYVGDAAEQSQTKYYMLSLIFKGILSPYLVIVACMCLPLCLVVIFFWFPHVHESCVASSEGTFVGRNLLSPLLINQADTAGNLLYLGLEASCYQAQRQVCTGIGTESQAQFHADWSKLHSFQEQHNISLQSLDLMGTCLDDNAMTMMMEDSCCGLKGYETTGCSTPRPFTCPIDSSVTPHTAFLPFETYLSEPSCQETFFNWTMVEPLYDCSNLGQVCSYIPCQGANKTLIHSRAIETDCQVELYAIDCCYFLLSAILHAIAMNMICTAIFQGLRHLHWRRLCPTGIKLKTQLQEDGSLAKGNEVIDRAEKIAKSIKCFELLGKLKLGVGIVLFLIWSITTSIRTAK